MTLNPCKICGKTPRVTSGYPTKFNGNILCKIAMGSPAIVYKVRCTCGNHSGEFTSEFLAIDDWNFQNRKIRR